MRNGNHLRTSASRRATARGWHLLIYRMPAEPASKRVSVWRDLHRLGALYLQQCVCILPTMEGPNAELSRITSKIPALGGDFTLIDLPLASLRCKTRRISRIPAKDVHYPQAVVSPVGGYLQPVVGVILAGRGVGVLHRKLAS